MNGRGKGAVAVVDQHGNIVGSYISYYQVRVGVAVQVPDGY